MSDPYVAAAARYAAMPYRRAGRSGLMLPAIALGLWHNFGDDRALDTQRAIVRRAFDRGVTHFDLANNYGPPPGSAEANFGRLLATDLKPHRDELVISTKAGWDMWPGPYGESSTTCSTCSRTRAWAASLIGASSVAQLDDSLGALEHLGFADDELAAIEPHAVDGGIDLWAAASTA